MVEAADFCVVGDEVVQTADRVRFAWRPVGCEIENDDVVRASVTANPVELFLDVVGGGFGVGQRVDVFLREASNGRVGEQCGKCGGVTCGVVQAWDIAVRETADANDQ